MRESLTFLLKLKIKGRQKLEECSDTILHENHGTLKMISPSYIEVLDLFKSLNISQFFSFYQLYFWVG